MGMISRAAVILNGEALSGLALRAAQQVAEECGLLVAADGGADVLDAAGLTPQLIVGDGDSLRGDFRAVPRLPYARRKDFTDGEAALRYALEQTAGSVLLLSALGGRPDHQLANLLLPLHTADPTRVLLLGADWQGCYIGAGGRELFGQPGETLSLLPLTPVQGLTLYGLEYPLSGFDAAVGDSRTISNVLASDRAQISLEAGWLLAIHFTCVLPAG